jgi:hypothetical protein
MSRFARFTLSDKPLSFVSPLPLEECATRLKNMAIRKSLLSPTFVEISVELQALTENAFTFRIAKWGRNQGTSEIRGTIQADNGSTLVHGISHIHQGTYIVLAAVLIIAVLVSLTVNYLVFFMGILMLAVFWLIFIRDRDDFVQFLQQTLSV